MRDPSTAAMVAELPLRDVFFNMDPMHEEKVNTFDNNLPDISTVRKLVFLKLFRQGMDKLLKGATMQPSPGVDNYFTKDVN